MIIQNNKECFSTCEKPIPDEMKQISDQLGLVQLQMEFMELKGSDELQREFWIKDVVDFWKLVGHLPNISRLARGIISMFPSTYQCEAAFSALSKIKCRNWNRHSRGPSDCHFQHRARLQISCVAEIVSEMALSYISTLPAVMDTDWQNAVCCYELWWTMCCVLHC